MIKFNKTNIYQIHLSLMRNVFEDGSLEGILIPIGNAIKNCENIINGTSSTNNEDYIDSVTDYEVEIIENILDECAQRLSTVIYVLMRWLAVLVIYPIINVLKFKALLWLLVGGLFYTIGAVIYALKKLPHTLVCSAFMKSSICLLC